MGLGGSDKIKDKAASGVYTFIPPKESVFTIIIPPKEEFVITTTPQTPTKEVVLPPKTQPKETSNIDQIVKQVETKKEQLKETKIITAEKKNIQPIKVSNYIPNPNVYIPTKEYRQMLKQVKKSRRR